MSKMFVNYDNNIDLELPEFEPNFGPRLSPMTSLPGISMLYNVKGECYGVEVKHQMPFELFFHLDEAHGWPLDSLINESSVELKILTRGNHKVILQKEFIGTEIFNSMSSDLRVLINQEEAQLLKQEAYEISVILRYPTGFYKLFTETDGLLVVR